MKKNLHLMIFCLSILLVFTACQTAKVDINTEVDTIRSLSEQWTNAIREKDHSSIMSMFSEQTVYMLDDMPIVIGKETIDELHGSWLSNKAVLHSSVKFTIEEIEVSSSGDLAYQRGKQSIEYLIPDGTVEEVNKSVTIWKKIDGEWKAIVVIANQDHP